MLTVVGYNRDNLSNSGPSLVYVRMKLNPLDMVSESPGVEEVPNESVRWKQL